MDRQLFDYLPPALQRVAEFAAITAAQQPELEKAWDALALVMDNQFIDTATAEGVSVWEKELNITPRNTDTLDERKRRVKTAWTYGVVYTYNWLVDWLKTACGTDTQLPMIEDYTLFISLPVSADYVRILNDLRRYVPANMIVDPRIELTKIDCPHYAGAAYRSGIRQGVQSDEWGMGLIQILADEQGLLLCEGADNIVFYEEVPV